MKYIAFLAVTFFINCLIFKGQSNGLITIDIEREFYNAQGILLSEFVESLEYIVLETDGNSILHPRIVYSTDNYLVCINVAMLL